MPEVSKPSRKKTLIIICAVVLFLLLLWLAVEVALPRVARSYIDREIRERYPQAGEISVSVKAFPALKLAFKKYDSLEVRVSDVELLDVDFSEIELESRRWPGGTFKATIGQEEITRFFTTKHSYVQEPQLSLEGESIRVLGKVSAQGLTVTIDATGTLEPSGGKLVYFRPDAIEVSGIRVPSTGVALVEEIMANNPVFTVRDDLPFDMTAIRVNDGKLEVEGTADLEEALEVQL